MVLDLSLASRLARVVIVLGSLPVLLILPRGGDPACAQAPEEPGEEEKPAGDPGKDAPKAKGKGKTSAGAAVDPEVVKESLKEIFHPTALEVLDDGRVKMEFDFGQKLEDHGTIFNVPVGAQLQDVFRWTRSDEERVVGGDPGLRVSNSGSAVLDVWFEDDVEAEIAFLQHINFDPRHIAAVVFVNARGAGVGSNYGSQCARFAGARMGKAAGRPTPVAFNSSARIKLLVKDGAFEAHRDGRQLAKGKYNAKSFAAGRIALVWGGSNSGTITKLTITGRVDSARLADRIRKGRK